MQIGRLNQSVALLGHPVGLGRNGVDAVVLGVDVWRLHALSLGFSPRLARTHLLSKFGVALVSLRHVHGLFRNQSLDLAARRVRPIHYDLLRWLHARNAVNDGLWASYPRASVVSIGGLVLEILTNVERRRSEIIARSEWL